MSFLARLPRRLPGRIIPTIRTISTTTRVYNASKDLAVGELEGTSWKIEPLKRTGESTDTLRARLLYQSRKRGILESDLLRF